MSTSTPRSSIQQKRAKESVAALGAQKENDSPTSQDSPSATGHQRFLLPDPVALSYLEEDKSTRVLDRSRKLEGYQSYVVEQWACSRTHPTFCIASYTGDQSDTIRVGILSVPADETTWSPRLRVYVKSIQQYHAKRRETPLGTLMVTSLSGFPSSLTIVHVPDGDLRKHREDFIVNENLKRLGCSGRVGLTLSQPTGATQAKFHQLYMTSERIDLYDSVIELVKLCQVALMLFKKLDIEYCDGLLCDVTEKAINDWWTSIGMDLYNVEPSDGALGPTTVAALIGTLIGARNRLNAYGAPVEKDIFDLDATKRAILYFQKSTKIPKTRRLDRHTLDQLHRATAKQAAGDGWIVPRAVKSTVAELSGKGGEMVMEMVGRDKANIAEVETVDIERLAHLVKGERTKWLWQGKPRKRTTRDIFSDSSTDRKAALPDPKLVPAISRQQKVVSGGSSIDLKPAATNSLSRPTTRSRRPSDAEVDTLAKRTIFNRAKGRLKDAVGQSPQDADTKGELPRYSNEYKKTESVNSADLDGPGGAPTWRDGADDELEEASPNKLVDARGSVDDLLQPDLDKEVTKVSTGTQPRKVAKSTHDEAHFGDPLHLDGRGRTHTPRTVTRDHSVAGSAAYSTDGEEMGPKETKSSGVSAATVQDPNRILQRRSSYSQYQSTKFETRNENFFTRHLSFSMAEDAVLPHNDLLDPDIASPDDSAYQPLAAQLRQLQAHLEQDKRLHVLVSRLTASANWTKNQLSAVDSLSYLASQDGEQLSSILLPRRDEYNALEENSRGVLADERARLLEALKDVETAGAKLEYEISGLKGKVEDVEDTVAEFERSVLFAEGRVAELVKSGEGAQRSGEGWSAWLSRRLFGVGRRPVESG